MRRSVSVGLNGSPESMAAARWAAGEAGRRALPLRLIYAGEWLPTPRQEPPEGFTMADGWPARMLAAAEAEIGVNHPGLQVVGEQIKRLPVEALSAAAGDAALLALGSRALGDISGFVFGSTALGVLARAAGPVVLVRGGGTGDETPGERHPARDVLLGLDRCQGSGTLLEFAFDAAARRGAVLCVIHTWRLPPSHGSPGAPAPAGGTEQAEAVSETLRPWRSKYPDVPVEEVCTRGRAATELVAAAPTASLLVVGRRLRHRPPVGPHIGPVTHAVIHHAVCPVAVVPHD